MVTGLIDCDCGACEDDDLAELAEAAAQAWLDDEASLDAKMPRRP